MEKKFGELTIPEESEEDVMGDKLYYYEYHFDSGWYRFMVQANGELAGIRMCRYQD